jgi:hypothetical protein
MAKKVEGKVEVKIGGIGDEIDRATGKLSAAAREVPSPVERKRLAAKIKTLNKVKAQVKMLCRSYTIIVPTE